MSEPDCYDEVVAIVEELEALEQEHREKVTSLLSPTVPAVTRAETYSEVAEMLQTRILETNE